MGWKDDGTTKILFGVIRGQYPFVILTLTNIPHHYAAAHQDDPSKHVQSMMTEHPETSKGKALTALYNAVPLYGNIPNEFPTF